MRNDSLPPEDLLNIFSPLVFSIKLSAYILAATGTVVFAIYLMDAKTYKGIAFLNKTYVVNLC